MKSRFVSVVTVLAVIFLLFSIPYYFYLERGRQAGIKQNHLIIREYIATHPSDPVVVPLGRIDWELPRHYDWKALNVAYAVSCVLHAGTVSIQQEAMISEAADLIQSGFISDAQLKTFLSKYKRITPIWNVRV